jgi:hypothetical protein
MSKSTAATVWIVVLVAVAAGGIAPAPAAGRPHFPGMLTGSFSGQDHFFTWQGTVSLKGHRRQTTYDYGGNATYTWTLKSPTTPSGDCQFVPSSGVIVEEVGVSVNRTRSGKAGYSYDGGNGAGGGTGDIKRVCPDPIDNSDFGTQIQGAFGSPLGGNSKNLRRFAGSDSSGEYMFQWSFFGHK